MPYVPHIPVRLLSQAFLSIKRAGEARVIPSDLLLQRNA